MNNNESPLSEKYGFIADQLATSGLCILSSLLPDQLVSQLQQRVTQMDDKQFQQAAIGQQQQLQLNTQVRQDQTCWLGEEHMVDAAYLMQMAEFRLAINQRLFLGLFDYEAHYAHYAPGAFYQRHLDAFKGQSSRILTTVLYLNRDWQPDQGGQLHIYAPDSDTVIATVEPEMGTFVIFLSEQFPHQVVESRQDRYSIAGWFRLQDPLQAPSI